MRTFGFSQPRNVMTAGNGIAHAEQTPRVNAGNLNGAQLWVALPDAARLESARFDAIERVPEFESTGGLIKIFSGALGDTRSPATDFSDLIGAEMQNHPGHDLSVDLVAGFEHGALLVDGDCTIDGQAIEPRRRYYLGTQRQAVSFGSRVLFIGGPPFPEKILMWWNFVARTPEEVAAARDDWQAGRRFGEVTAYKGPRLEAPDLARIAPANRIS